MSRNALPALALTGQPQVLNVGPKMDGLSLRLGNESDLTLLWVWGSQSGLLYPSEVDVLRPDTLSSPQIQFQPQTILPRLVTTRNLLAEQAYLPDEFPGTYPQQMSRLTQPGFVRPTLPSFSVPHLSTGLSKTITVDPTTTDLRIVPQATVVPGMLNSGVASWSFSLQGQTSNAFYWGRSNGNPVPPVVPDNPITVPIDPENDLSYTLKVTNPGNLALYDLTLLLSECYQPEAVQTYTQQVGPAPWQSPTTPVSFNVSINSGASATLLASTSGTGNAYYLRGWSVGTSGANAAGRLQKVHGAVIAVDMDCNTTRQMVLSGDHQGMYLNNAVTITNQGAAADFVAANQDYTLGPV